MLVIDNAFLLHEIHNSEDYHHANANSYAYSQMRNAPLELAARSGMGVDFMGSASGLSLPAMQNNSPSGTNNFGSASSGSAGPSMLPSPSQMHLDSHMQCDGPSASSALKGGNRMQPLETSPFASKFTVLRLTQQSTGSKKKKCGARVSVGKQPFEFSPEVA